MICCGLGAIGCAREQTGAAADAPFTLEMSARREKVTLGMMCMGRTWVIGMLRNDRVVLSHLDCREPITADSTADTTHDFVGCPDASFHRVRRTWQTCRFRPSRMNADTWVGWNRESQDTVRAIRAVRVSGVWMRPNSVDK